MSFLDGKIPEEPFNLEKSFEEMAQSEEERTLKDYDGEDKIVYSYEVEAMVASESDALYRIESNYFPDLSKSIGGFIGGEVVVISGWSGHGKTLFTQSLTSDFAEQAVLGCWFSYEVTPYWFLKRFGSVVPVFLMPASMKANSSNWIFERIKEAILKCGIKCVYIDHLHYIIDMMGNSRRNRSDEIGEVMRKLKVFALEQNIVIFLIAHTAKPKGGDADSLELGSVRDSSFIEQEADTVLYVWRARDRLDGSFIKIAKDRKQGTLNKTIKLLKRRSYLMEADLYGLEA